MVNVMPINGKSNNELSAPTVRRTRAGSEELVIRRLGLEEYQRQILLLANGRRSIDEIITKIPMLEEDPDLLMGLQQAGLIELFDPELESNAQQMPTREPAAPMTAPSAQSVDSPRSTRVSAERMAGIKRAVISELTKALGSESAEAVDRVEAVVDEAELKDLMPKLVGLIKLYSGASIAEAFASKFSVRS